MVLTASDKATITRKIEMLTSDGVRTWIAERHANCLRIAGSKPAGPDRDGWLDDAAYFSAVMGLIDWTADEYAENRPSNHRIAQALTGEK